MPKDKRVRNSELEDAKSWERLGISPTELQKHPRITQILLKSLSNIDNVVEFLRGAEAKEAIELVRLWDESNKREKALFPFEAYCIAAKSTPSKMMGIIMQAVVDQGSARSELMLAMAGPEVVAKTVKMAKTNKGVDERKIVLQNRGVMATPKNNVFNNFGSVSQDNRKQVANVTVAQLSDDNDKITGAVDGFNAERALRSGQPTEKVEIIDVVVED